MSKMGSTIKLIKDNILNKSKRIYNDMNENPLIYENKEVQNTILESLLNKIGHLPYDEIQEILLELDDYTEILMCNPKFCFDTEISFKHNSVILLRPSYVEGEFFINHDYNINEGMFEYRFYKALFFFFQHNKEYKNKFLKLESNIDIYTFEETIEPMEGKLLLDIFSFLGMEPKETPKENMKFLSNFINIISTIKEHKEEISMMKKLGQVNENYTNPILYYNLKK